MNIPNKCESLNTVNQNDKCPLNPYKLIEEESSFIDYQYLKLQETNESTPNGETPRTYKMCVERSLCDKLIPGNRV